MKFYHLSILSVFQTHMQKLFLLESFPTEWPSKNLFGTYFCHKSPPRDFKICATFDASLVFKGTPDSKVGKYTEYHKCTSYFIKQFFRYGHFDCMDCLSQIGMSFSIGRDGQHLYNREEVVAATKPNQSATVCHSYMYTARASHFNT